MRESETEAYPKISLHLPNVRGYSSFEYMLELAKVAQKSGLSGIYVSDHILYPPEYSNLFGKTGMLESTTVLSALASQVNRMSIGTSILLPLRHPIHSASALATIDQISRGQLVVGLGIGWNKQEFNSLGFKLSQRAQIINDWGKALRTLWENESATYHGQFFHFEEVNTQPRPYHSPHPPILVGGAITNALERVNLYGDGWMPDAPTLKEFKEGIQRIRASNPPSRTPVDRFMINIWASIGNTDEQAVERAKFMIKDETSPPWTLPLQEFLERSIVGKPEKFARRVRSYWELGAEEVIVGLPPFGDEIKMLQLIGAEVIPAMTRK